MNRIIEVKGNNHSQVVIGGVKTTLPKFIEGRKAIVITDEKVFKIYSSLISEYPHIVIKSGEEHKTLSDLEPIYTRLLELEADRHSCVVGFGGGIVTDITGFVASTYQRGVDFGFVATTLLSQVDASVGGKNGVNLHGFKNMIGVFNQPRFVVCDVELLSTLPQREFRAGLSEIIKAGVIKSRSLFEKFENNNFNNFLNNKSLLEEVIYESIKIKADVVEQDEHEKGERKKLNFGHTFAHAIEKSSRRYNHGEAVAIGMVTAAQIAQKIGCLLPEDCERITKTIEKMGFDATSTIDKHILFEALKSDKKRNNKSIDFVLPTEIGSCVVQNIDFDKLETYI